MSENKPLPSAAVTCYSFRTNQARCSIEKSVRIVEGSIEKETCQFCKGKALGFPDMCVPAEYEPQSPEQWTCARPSGAKIVEISVKSGSANTTDVRPKNATGVDMSIPVGSKEADHNPPLAPGETLPGSGGANGDEPLKEETGKVFDASADVESIQSALDKCNTLDNIGNIEIGEEARLLSYFDQALNKTADPIENEFKAEATIAMKLITECFKKLFKLTMKMSQIPDLNAEVMVVLNLMTADADVDGIEVEAAEKATDSYPWQKKVDKTREVCKGLDSRLQKLKEVLDAASMK
eukprot:GFYU01013120.1.p1 GENE.GFYU01013120.1~~GFYU01013120.1.p1  ORF type:complete len:294 (+),score=102.94 GFYU01013120.1:334-1215(+)